MTSTRDTLTAIEAGLFPDVFAPIFKPPDNPRTSILKHGAFVVTETSLRDLVTTMSNFVSEENTTAEPLVRITVFQAGIPPLELTNVADVAAMRNPKGTPIIAVSIRVTSLPRDVFVCIDSSGSFQRCAITIAALAASPPHLSKVRGQIQRELHNIGVWYSPHRFAIDAGLAQLGRIPSGFWAALFLIPSAIFVIAFVFLAIIAVIQQLSAGDPLQDGAPALRHLPVKEAMPESVVPTTVPRQPPESISPAPSNLADIIRIIVFFFLAFSSGIAFPKAFRLFFPRVVFEIGEGKDRHRDLVHYRRFFLCSVLGLAVLLPFIKDWLGSLFF